MNEPLDKPETISKKYDILDMMYLLLISITGLFILINLGLSILMFIME